MQQSLTRNRGPYDWAGTTQKQLERYEVIFKDDDGNRWSSFYMAEDFSHAEEQALNGAGANPDPIVQIVRDYE